MKFKLKASFIMMFIKSISMIYPRCLHGGEFRFWLD